MANFKDPTTIYKDNNYLDLMKDFEKSRIEKLQEERENVQQKTFTKWCNSFLSKHGMEINNLFRDLEDGKRLIKLLECISNKKLGKPNQGRMRVHKIENVNMALAFIQSQLQLIGAKLESIGAEDIVDGNRTLILGLVWTIILRFQISEITTPDDEPPTPDGKLKNSKEILLLWCQRRTAGYPGVRIVDFTQSWRDGRAFNALINSQRPDLFDYNRVLQLDNLTNLEHAFEQAERNYGIAKILDAEDIDVDKPDEKLILTYVATIYHAFAKLKTEVVGGKRIGKVVAYLQEIDRNKEQYEQQMAELMSWITRKEIELADHQFPNSLDGIKKLMLTFNKGYMALEKPPKYKEKGMLEANFYNINMKLSAQGHPKYVPPEGKTINDLEMCWSALERAEHERDLALKKELNRQEQLEQMYENFDKKAKLREDWLNEMSNILSSSIMQQAATSQIDATFRKHEAIGADINARSERFNRLDELAKVLVDEDYFFKDTVKKRNQQIQIAYMNLLSQFDKRKATLASFQELALLFQEIESLKNEMLDLEKSFQSKEYGDYLLAVEDLITKHSLLESQIAGINQHLKSVNRRAQQFIRQEATTTTTATTSASSPPASSQVLQPSSTSSSLSNLSSPASTSHSSTPPESLSPSGADSRSTTVGVSIVLSEGQLVREKVDALNKAFDLITVLGAERRKYLEERRDYHKFLEEADEELMWISEKNQILKSSESGGHDLGSTQILINKHEQLEDEIKFRVARIDKLLAQGTQLKTATNTKPGSTTATYRFSAQEQAKIVVKCQMLAARFGELKEAATQRRALLEDSYTSQQYHVDANEAESWVKDKLALVSLSSDSGRDEAQAQAALKRHVRVQEEIKAYEPEMKRLQEISDILIGKRRFSSIPADMKQQVMRAQKRNALVSTGVSLISDTEEIETDETDNDETDASSSINEEYVEREYRETYSEEVLCACVKALYPYQAKTMSINRGEILELKERSNADWWLVEKNTGIEGYVPATYLKEIGMQKLIKQRERIVKKPELVRRTSSASRKAQQQQQHQPIIKARGTLNSSIVRRKTTSIKPRQLQHLSTESLKARQVEINYLYNQLLTLSIERRKQLDNTIAFFKWSRKHDELSKWVREKQAQISNKNHSVLENPDAMKRVYQAFIGDYLANQAEYAECERLAKELVSKKLSFPVDGVQVTSESIARRQDELAKEWARLAELKKYWDESIKAIQCIDQFNSLCAEVDDLIKEKLTALENSDISNETSDVRTVRALQSKQDKLEREIGPLEKNCADLHRLADEVCRYFPQDKASVARKCEHIDTQWAKLKESVRLRKLRLDEKHGLQRFENEWNDVAKACAKVRLALAEIDAPQDLKSGEEMEKRLTEIEHDSIKNEIDFKIDDLGKLGQALINKKGTAAENANKIRSSLEQINGEKVELAHLVVEKRHYLEDYLKYLKFKQDATNFELIMQDQEAYLQFDDVGSSASNVDALQKRHDEFVAKMNAQDEKLKLLDDQLKKLTGPKRVEMERVYDGLVERRKRLKSAANERKIKLAQSKEFFEFKIECDDLEAWIAERRRFLEQIKTENTEIERVVTKHETVEKELNANRTRLEKLVATGEDLMSRRVKSEETRQLVERIKKNWADLERQTAYNGEKLAEAKLKADLAKSLNDVEARMRNLTKEVAQPYQTNDLRSVKDALKKHQDLKNQLRVELDLVDDLSRAEAHQLGNRPSSSGESSAGAIAEYAEKFAALTPLLEQKQKELENALVLKQLLFDLDEQLKWIEQTSRQLEMLTSKAPQTLFDATNVHKKVCELERSLLNNHKPNVDKILNQSKLHLSSIPRRRHNEDEEELANKTELLETEWLRLLKDVELKKFMAAKALSEQQCLDELNQIMAGLSEKWLIIDNADVIQSQDETLLNKHMAKLNQLKDELKGYNDILNKINKEQVSKLKSTSTQVEPKYQACRSELTAMEEQIEEKKLAVKCQLEALEFGRETAELIQWMNEKRAQAQSEDYGQDLEHLNLIKAKFTQLKDEVRSSEPKYQRLKRLGQDLLTSRVGESKPIRKRLDDLKSTREQLEAELAQRELILDSAAEIHRFNKDVQDLLRCITEKEAAFVSDLGRDSNTCELLQRKHQIYIEELQALKNQLAELNKQSEVLRQRHPGDTAECVAAEMDELIDRFKALWLMSERRTRELKQASDYFKFMSCIRDVSEWMLDTHRSLIQPMQFADMFSVSQAKEEHDNLSFEMSQRDDLFKSLEEMCLQLTGGASSAPPSSPSSNESSHPNKKDIIMRTNAAMIERENLFRLWDLKNKVLESQYDCHEFYRDANQVLGTISSMEIMVAKAYQELDANLALDEPRITVDDLESLAKTNENLKKKLDKQSHEKVVELQKKANLLIECERARVDVMDSHHRQIFNLNEVGRLEESLFQVLKRENDLNEMSLKRTRQLNDALKFFRLKRDVDEFLTWIDDRVRYAQTLSISSANLTTSSSFNDQVKLFQRQKALNVEIEANSARYTDLNKRCKEELVSNKTVRPVYMRRVADELTRAWQRLAFEAAERAKEFDEAKDLLEFNDQLEQLELWLKDKELMIQNGDTGRDYEHCVSLMKRADEAISPIYEEKLHSVLAMGDKLAQGRSGAELDDLIQKKKRILNRFEQVKAGVEEYKISLKHALEMHQFMRDYDDLDHRIKEKIKLLGSDPEPKTLDAVQVAQSKLLDLEHDMTAIGTRLAQQKREAAQLIAANERRMRAGTTTSNEDLELKNNLVRMAMKDLEANWAQLSTLVEARKVKLASIGDFQRFLVEYKDLLSWMQDMQTRMSAQAEPVSLSEAELALNLHAERRTEIDGKTHRFIALRQMATQLAPEYQPESSRLMRELLDAEQALQLKAAEKAKFLQDAHEYQSLKEHWKQVENWLKSVEAGLKSKECGDSVLGVEALLAKHKNVESSIRSQLAPGAAFDALEQRAKEMIKQGHSKSTLIQGILEDVHAGKRDLEQLANARRQLLEHSLMYQNFLLNYYDCVQWIKEKTATAMDKNYADLTNLQTKIQRHATFTSDLKKSGQKRVDDIHSEADALRPRSDLDEMLSDLDSQWLALKQATDVKRKRLDDAYKCVHFTRQCDDLAMWFDEAELELGSDDQGRDLASCKLLLLRHETLVKQIESQRDKLTDLEGQLAASKENFMYSKMQEAFGSVKQRYLNLSEPCSIRHDNLDESLRLFEVCHELDDLTQWTNEKLAHVGSADQIHVTSLDETKKLLNKHQQLCAELKQQQPVYASLQKTTKQLIDRKHFSHALLSTKLNELEQKWNRLADLVDQKSIRLEQVLEMQIYFAEVDELNEWLKEKHVDLLSPDYGKTDSTVLTNLKKCQALSADLKQNKQVKLNQLAEKSSQLQSNGARDAADRKTIARKQSDLEALYTRVLEVAVQREQALSTMLRIFEFERECEATQMWMRDQTVVAASQDFGADLEHADALLKKFLEFMAELDRNADRVNRLDELAQLLCENKYTPKQWIEVIDERCGEMNRAWQELNTLAEVRRQTLEGAIEVHAFDKDCDDLIAWAQEKENLISDRATSNSDHLLGYDVASFYTLAKQQESLESELDTLHDELERLSQESARLCAQYPETRDHIETRLEDARSQYESLLRELKLRNERIQWAREWFSFASEFHELSEWFRDMLARVTAQQDLNTIATGGGNEVNSAEMLVKRHRELKIEIDLQQSRVLKFAQKADELAARKKTSHAMQQEIKSKKESCMNSWRNLNETWHSRQDLYEHNLEYNKLAREIKLLDAWLSSKDSYVHTDLLGDTIASVEAQLKQHEDFESMLKAMEARFEALKRENKLEKTLRELKERENAQRVQADMQLEEERRKDAERRRKLELRRQDERRRTQEIIANISSAEPTPSMVGVVVDVNSDVPTADVNQPGEVTLKRGPSSIKKDRNRTRSIRDKYKLPLRLPPPSIGDYLRRKQEFQKGGQRAPIREYQPFYTTIHANLMCFFLDKRDYNELNAAAQPISLFECRLSRLEETTLQRDVIHVETTDGAEYLFDAAGDDDNRELIDLWYNKIAEASAIPSLSVLSMPSTSTISTSSMSNVLNTSQSATSIGTEPNTTTTTITISPDQSQTNMSNLKPRSRAPLMVVSQLPTINSVTAIEVEPQLSFNKQPSSTNNSTTPNTNTNTNFAYDLSIAAFNSNNFLFFDHHHRHHHHHHNNVDGVDDDEEETTTKFIAANANTTNSANTPASSTNPTTTSKTIESFRQPETSPSNTSKPYHETVIKLETVQHPVSTYSSSSSSVSPQTSSNASDNVGHLDINNRPSPVKSTPPPLPPRGEERRPVSIIKSKPPIYSSLSPRTSLLVEPSQLSPKSPTTISIQHQSSTESSISELIKPPSTPQPQGDLRQMSYNIAVNSDKSSTTNSPSIDDYRTRGSQQAATESTSDYGVRSIVLGDPKKSNTLPNNNNSSTMSSSDYTSIKTAAAAKEAPTKENGSSGELPKKHHKKNIFNSLFKSKPKHDKYEVKQSSTDEDSMHGSPTSSKKKNK